MNNNSGVSLLHCFPFWKWGRFDENWMTQYVPCWFEKKSQVWKINAVKINHLPHFHGICIFFVFLGWCFMIPKWSYTKHEIAIEYYFCHQNSLISPWWNRGNLKFRRAKTKDDSLIPLISIIHVVSVSTWNISFVQIWRCIMLPAWLSMELWFLPEKSGMCLWV